MTDIVERLRDDPARDCCSMRGEAANEIERLREGIRKLETVHRQRNEQRDLTAAENERLREVLRLFTQPCDCLNVCQQEPSNAGPRHCPRIIARAALEGKE